MERDACVGGRGGCDGVMPSWNKYLTVFINWDLNTKLKVFEIQN